MNKLIVIYIQGWMVCRKCRSIFLSIISSCNEEVDALRHFFDGFKMVLCVVIDFAYGQVMLPA